MRFVLEIDLDKITEPNRLQILSDRLKWVADSIVSKGCLIGVISLPTKDIEIGEFSVEKNFAFGGDGVIAIDQEMLPCIFRGTLSMASSSDGQAWVCIDGASALRFNPKGPEDDYE